MNLEQISDNAEKSLEQMAKLSFGGKLLEDVNSEALQVTEEKTAQHKDADRVGGDHRQLPPIRPLAGE